MTFDIGKIATDRDIGSFSIGGKDSRGIAAIPNCNYIGESYLDINFTGRFNQLATFLNTLERHQPVIFVDDFTISQSTQRYAGHRINLNVAVFVKTQ